MNADGDHPPDWMDYAEFTLGEWLFKSFQPAHDGAPHEWLLVATDGDRKLERHIPMFHTNIFGPDVEDVAALEEAVEVMIKELGLE